MTMEVTTTRRHEVAAPMDEQLPALLQLAVEKDLDVEKLGKLIELQERVMDRHAEMAMAQALAAFQTECPPIPRDRVATVLKNGVKQYEYKFAALEKIAKVIQPHLTKNGLSFTHDAEISETHCKVICTLQHVEGAKRRATFTAPFDNSGGKNPLQAVGSARSYGRRYSLLDVLGLVTEIDNDGNSPQPELPLVTRDQAAKLASLADEILSDADKERFLRIMGVAALDDLPAEKFAEALEKLNTKKANDELARRKKAEAST